MSTSTLREQNAEATRVRILSAVADLLEAEQAEDLTMPSVAEAAGVSLRTLYRYYPTRAELLDAAAKWIGEDLLAQPFPGDLDEVAEVFRVGCADFDKRPGLVRAMALSQLGKEVRGYRRRGRVKAIRNALDEELAALPEDERRRAEAVLSYLHNMLAYTTLREENGMSGEEIGEAMGWAMRTLIVDLRRRNQRRTK